MAALDPKGLLAAIDWRVRERFLALAATFEQQTGMRLKVRSARRTCAEQAEQYGIGRTYNIGSPPVTYARGCQSWHVLGRAVDADIVDAAGTPRGDCARYQQAGTIWEQQFQGVWGGRFTALGPCGDQGHFEWHPDVKLADLCPNPDACEQATTQIVSVQPGPGVLLALLALGVGAALGYGSLHA